MMISIYSYYAAMKITLFVINRRRKPKNPCHKYITQLEREGFQFREFMVEQDTP